jgi:hypothetical protein
MSTGATPLSVVSTGGTPLSVVSTGVQQHVVSTGAQPLSVMSTAAKPLSVMSTAAKRSGDICLPTHEMSPLRFAPVDMTERVTPMKNSLPFPIPLLWRGARRAGRFSLRNEPHPPPPPPKEGNQNRHYKGRSRPSLRELDPQSPYMAGGIGDCGSGSRNDGRAPD